ncbi:hypothetical protein Tco_0479281 [Tanacetum coccineum]
MICSQLCPALRIPLTKFFVAVLKYFRIHISQLSPFGAARISHFEVLTRVLDLGPSVAVFRAFYTRIYSDGLFSFVKRSLSAPSCLSKPPDSIKNWADHFFWVDSRVFPISVPLYTGGVLEKDPAPHLTACQKQAVQHSGSGSGAGPEVSASSARENVVAEENVIPVSTYVDFVDPEGDLTVVEKEKEMPLGCRESSLASASGTGGKTLASLRRTILEGSLLLGFPSRGTSLTLRFHGKRGYKQLVVTHVRTLAGSPAGDGKDAEIARVKSLVKEEGDGVRGGSSLVIGLCFGEDKSFFSAEVLGSLRECYLHRRITDISLLVPCVLNSCAALDDSQAACDEARNLISSLSSERDGLAFEE